MTEPSAGGRQVRPFADWLREQARGKTHDELSDGLHDLVARAMDTGKKGSLRLTIVVEPLDRVSMKVTDEIVLKLPEHDRPASVAFVDKTGNLTRQNPEQPSLPLRSLDDDRPPGVDRDGVITG